MNSEDTYDSRLTSHLKINAMTWQNLQESGIADAPELAVEFLYYSPTKDKADSLRDALDQNGYRVSVKPWGNFLRRTWLTTGTTTASGPSLEKLNKWVEWMVTAGVEHDSLFDGWGVQTEALATSSGRKIR